MYRVYLWVFGRGWKLILETEQHAQARTLIEDLLPMELQLTWPTGRNQWFGQAMCPLR